ncbi:hypothetical protein BDZ94DRAFT_1253119 [Collybia nuda]|uniref:Secreted protein n=1 Tax=Collybia nuda TaxID=64659 RepID=A0A9P5YDN8_9AGAR|nr:hypothetical protein BDZ94DRAFT_1253119 [Collybia nuda]
MKTVMWAIVGILYVLALLKSTNNKHIWAQCSRPLSAIKSSVHKSNQTTNISEPLRRDIQKIKQAHVLDPPSGEYRNTSFQLNSSPVVHL